MEDRSDLTRPDEPSTDFSAIPGHHDVKRALEIAAAGGHDVLMTGPPGCGKSILADAFPGILPDLPNDEMLEVYSVYHLAKESRGFSARPPYRSSHHSASAISLVGGGTYPKPGEISFAHRGVLILDELGEFSRKTLDMIWRNMESGEVTIIRVRQSVTYPSSFILWKATNPCPCGYFGSSARYCTCSSQQIRAYQLRASGPLLDRLDFVLRLKSVGLKEDKPVETSAAIRERVTQAHARQRAQYGGTGLNGTLSGSRLLAASGLTEIQFEKIGDICFYEKWSNRSQVKPIRLARKIADLAETVHISEEAIQEAAHWNRLAAIAHRPSPL